MSLAQDLRSLWSDADQLWAEFRRHSGPLFHHLVPADYTAVAAALRTLRPEAETFLEFGSGIGAITVAAARLGYEAYGIEIDPWMVDRAEALARKHEAPATFARGSFVPVEFAYRVEQQAIDMPWLADGEPAYEELGMDLDDFDLIYAFPWPGQRELLEELLQRHARPGARFLSWDATEGIQVTPIRATELDDW